MRLPPKIYFQNGASYGKTATVLLKSRKKYFMSTLHPQVISRWQRKMCTSVLTFYSAFFPKASGLIEQAASIEGRAQSDSEAQGHPTQGASHAAKQKGMLKASCESQCKQYFRILRYFYHLYLFKIHLFIASKLLRPFWNHLLFWMNTWRFALCCLIFLVYPRCLGDLKIQLVRLEDKWTWDSASWTKLLLD